MLQNINHVSPRKKNIQNHTLIGMGIMVYKQRTLKVIGTAFIDRFIKSYQQTQELKDIEPTILNIRH